MALVTRAMMLLIVLILTVGVLVMLIYMFSPLETSSLVSKSLSVQMASKISGMLTAPNNMVSYLPLPGIECSISVSAGMVNATAYNYSYMSPYMMSVENPVAIVVKQPILCDEGDSSRVSLKKMIDSEGKQTIEIDIAR
jgi:hypothetical protein